MTELLPAVTSLEFWFGVSVGVAFNKMARQAIKERVFGDKSDSGET